MVLLAELVQEAKNKYGYSTPRTRGTGELNIAKHSNKYEIKKSINGKESYYGRYNTLEFARRVKQKLIQRDWDKTQLHHIVLEVETELKEPSLKHIQFNSAGRPYLMKTRNYKYKYYGTYDTLEEAQLVRNKLIEHNWDKRKLKRIQKEVKKDLIT